MELRRHGADDPDLRRVLSLIQTSFAYMDGVVNPPSSMHRLTLEALRAQADTAEVWSLAPPLSACVILTPKPKTLYIGKLCVTEHARGQGLSQRLIDHAATRARSLDRDVLELDVRIELTINHAAFTAMGFQEVSRSAHPGFDHPTSIKFHKPLTH